MGEKMKCKKCGIGSIILVRSIVAGFLTYMVRDDGCILNPSIPRIVVSREAYSALCDNEECMQEYLVSVVADEKSGKPLSMEITESIPK